MPPFRIEWREEGRVDVRRLDRTTAMRLFDGIHHYAQTGAGNVAPLHGPLAGSFRLRLGDYRVLFTLENKYAGYLRGSQSQRGLSLSKNTETHRRSACRCASAPPNGE